MKEFVSMFRYKMEGAREEWYSDFAERSRTQYDLLGHITDWLRTLSTSIENHYVVFEKPDPWMIINRAEKKEREKPIIPPSIFDVPWATEKVPSLDFQPFKTPKGVYFEISCSWFKSFPSRLADLSYGWKNGRF